MLNDLNSMQSAESESVQHTEMQFSIATRDGAAEELVERVYTFSYAQEWDKWTFQEYLERRSPDTSKITDRNWRQARHLFWHEASETPSVDVPSEVAERLAEATGSESVTIQVPAGVPTSNEYETVHTAGEAL